MPTPFGQWSRSSLWALLLAPVFLTGCATISGSSEDNPRGWAYIVGTESDVSRTAFYVDGQPVRPVMRLHHHESESQDDGRGRRTTWEWEVQLPAIYLNNGKPFTSVMMVRDDGVRRELLVPRTFSSTYVWSNMMFTAGIGNVIDAASRKHYRYPSLPVSDAFAQAEERITLVPYWQEPGNVIHN